MQKLNNLSKQELINEIKRLNKIINDIRKDDQKLASYINELIKEEV